MSATRASEPAPSGTSSTTAPTTGSPTAPTAAPTTAPTTDVAPTTTAPPAGTPASATVATYWTRPYGDGRPVQLPFYADPETGPKPHLVYGSMTNTGTAAIVSPTVVVTWRDAAGAVIHTASAAAIDPLGTPLASLAPGESADVLVVVADPEVAPRLDGATAETGAWSG